MNNLRKQGRILVSVLAIGALGACSTFPISNVSANATNAVGESSPNVESLIGDWDVSLYFSPSQPPSSTSMTIKSVDGGVLQGTFYGTEFDVGRATIRKSDIVFSVATRDNSGQYLTSGRLDSDGVIRGQTLSVGRDFLMAWEAKKSDAQ